MFMFMFKSSLIQVELLIPARTPESSNFRSKRFSLRRGQGDPWSMAHRGAMPRWALEMKCRLWPLGARSIGYSLSLAKAPSPLNEYEKRSTPILYTIITNGAATHNQHCLVKSLLLFHLSYRSLLSIIFSAEFRTRDGLFCLRYCPGMSPGRDI